MDSVECVRQTGARSEGFAWFPAGVVGKAMGFDGIRSVVKVPNEKIPDLSRGFTVSAWVALEAYPWTMLAVVDQESKEEAGYFLGLHPEGYPGLWMADGKRWLECRAQTKLSLYEWNHLVGTWSPEAGLRLYVNGREVAAVQSAVRFVPAQNLDVWIGRNHTPRALYSVVQLPDMAMQKLHLTPCSLDGLVDEVRIEAGALGASAIAARYQEQRPSGPRPLHPPRLPAGPDGPGEFGAVYTRLRYTDAWEHYWRVGADPDVLVRFDRAPYRFVFWRGTSFVPCWVTGNGIWYANEFLETGENGKPSGAEPMADKQTRNSHVRIIESTPARVVVHWRYAPLYTDYSLAHVNPESGWGDWVDEYYTIYPDGVAARKICVHSDYPYALPGSDPREGGFREYHESLVINPPGTAPQDNIKTNGLTLANMDGQTVTYSWEKGPPGKLDKTSREYPDYLRKEKSTYKWRTWLADIPNPNIHLVNLKADHSPFVIVPSEGAMVDSYTREIRPAYSIFPWWNHWPVTQVESVGRWAYATDRPSHSSLSHIYWAPYEQGEQGLTKIMLHGMTGGTATNLIPLAQSWLHPPALQVVDGLASVPNYDPSQRAYRLSVDTSKPQNKLQLRLACRPGQPAVNPALVVVGWGERPIKVSLNGCEAIPDRDFRVGFIKTTAGTDLIIWIERQATEPLAITLASMVLTAETGAAPADIYVKKDSFSATLLAMRDQYQTLLDAFPLRLSPWSATQALKAKGLADVLFPEQGVDLTAKDDQGQPVWLQHTEWTDNVAHHLPASDSTSTYLFRTITVKTDTTVTVGFGSDDGIEVWLNNKKLHSNNANRGVSLDEDKVQLELKAGENRLLVKIFNGVGNSGFSFNSGSVPPVDIWPMFLKDYPVQAAWLKRDTEGRLTDWLNCRNSVAADKALISCALAALGQQGILHQTMAKLEQANVPANDSRWLDLYLRACQIREAKESAGRFSADALRRAIEDLSSTYKGKYARGPEFLKRLDVLQKRIDALHLSLDRGELTDLSLQGDLLALQRDALLANPLMDFERLLLVKRDNLGLPQNWQGNTSIGRHGYDAQIAVLSPVRPEGKLTPLFKPQDAAFVGDMDLDFDGTRMLFSMPAKDAWQVWEIKADGSGLRQLTPDIPKVDNFDACYLPDGKVLFNSTMNIHGVPCVGGGDKVGNLCRMDADGKNVRMLCFEQDQDWYPRVLSDGRVMYTRWEYSDTKHYHSRLLMSMNPDGTGQLSLYGSNSYWPNAIFYARQVPGAPSKIIAIVSGHHGVPRMGELVLFDLARGRTEASGAVQRIPGYGKKVEPVIADGLVENSWPKFLHPYPLSEKYFIVSCKPSPESRWGIYLVDVFDNMLCLAEEEGYELFEPIPFRKRVKPAVIPDRVRPEMKEGTVNLSDVYAGPGLKGVQKGTVKALRLYSFHFGYWGIGGHVNIGVDGSWDGRRIIGTVPVYEDGSANFKVPANTPIAIQPLNERGEAVALMRSWFVVMPGENASCVGCHESVNSSPLTKPSLAMRRAPSAITPWNGPERPFSFRREVQPVLDKSCVGCHDGTKSGRPDFRGNRKGDGNFDASYLALMPFVRRPGPESDFHVLTPMDYHVSTSELFQMLRKGHHNVVLEADAWSRLTTWVDLNVPCHGTWGEHRGAPMGEPATLRNEYRKLYANTTDNPESYPTPEPAPVAFVKPAPAAPRHAPAVTADGWPFDTAEAQRRQAAAGLPKELQLACGTNSNVKLDFVLIPAGDFVIGTAAGADDENPPTRVRITKPFYMSRTEISNAQFREFDGTHDSRTIDIYAKDHTGSGPSVNQPEQPAVRVSWKEAVAFCDWVGSTTGQRCALPTEAQWEYACRAGTTTPLWFGDLTANFAPFANLADANLRHGMNTVRPWIPAIEAVNDGAAIPQDVGAYQPNPWGLYNMHGNAAEWTRSLCQPYPYRDDDGRNAITGKQMGQRSVRGGSFWDRPYRATSSARRSYEPWQRVFDVGFRIILEPDAATSEKQR